MECAVSGALRGDPVAEGLVVVGGEVGGEVVERDAGFGVGAGGVVEALPGDRPRRVPVRVDLGECGVGGVGFESVVRAGAGGGSAVGEPAAEGVVADHLVAGNGEMAAAGGPAAGVEESAFGGLRLEVPDHAEVFQGLDLGRLEGAGRVRLACPVDPAAQREAACVVVEPGDVEVPMGLPVGGGGLQAAPEGRFAGVEDAQPERLGDGVGGEGPVEDDVDGHARFVLLVLRLRVGGLLGDGETVSDAVVVCTQGLEDPPERAVQVGAHEVVGVFTGGDVDGDDQGGLLALAGLLSKGAADRLDGVDDRLLGIGEDHGVDAGDVHALAEKASVRDHRAEGRREECARAAVEAVQELAAVGGVLVAVEAGRPQFTGVGAAGSGLVERVEEGGGLAEGVGEGVGVGHAVVEGDDAAQVELGHGAQDGDLEGGLAQFGFGGLVGDPEPGADGGLIHLHDDDPVVGQEVFVDGLGEREAKAGVAVEGWVVHGRDERVVLVVSGLAGRPDPRGGGEVEPLVRGDQFVVMDGGPAFSQVTTGAVGFVDRHQRPGGESEVGVGVLDAVQGVVGGENRQLGVLVDGGGQGGRVGGERDGLARGVGALGAQGEDRAAHAGGAPVVDGLGEELQGGQQHQPGALGGDTGGGARGDVRLAGAAGHHDGCPGGQA